MSSETRGKLTCTNGGFSWSHTHKSPFELSKTALMNFPRSYRDPIPGALALDKPNADGSVMTTLMNPVSSYKYLGVIFDPKLCWSLQHKKVAAAALFWASQIGQLSKSASGLPLLGCHNTSFLPICTSSSLAFMTWIANCGLTPRTCSRWTCIMTHHSSCLWSRWHCSSARMCSPVQPWHGY